MDLHGKVKPTQQIKCRSASLARPKPLPKTSHSIFPARQTTAKTEKIRRIFSLAQSSPVLIPHPHRSSRSLVAQLGKAPADCQSACLRCLQQKVAVTTRRADWYSAPHAWPVPLFVSRTPRRSSGFMKPPVAHPHPGKAQHQWTAQPPIICHPASPGAHVGAPLTPGTPHRTTSDHAQQPMAAHPACVPQRDAHPASVPVAGSAKEIAPPRTFPVAFGAVPPIWHSPPPVPRCQGRA